VEDEHKESLVEKIKDRLKDAVGLPPGKFPDGEPKPTTSINAPRGTLTADDTEDLPPHGNDGTGFQKI